MDPTIPAEHMTGKVPSTPDLHISRAEVKFTDVCLGFLKCLKVKENGELLL